MKSLCLSVLLLGGTALTPAFADIIPAASHVDAVTVYPQGAEVTRSAEVTFAPGEHALVFDALPGDLDSQTIRVEGDAAGQIEIGSVDARLSYVPAANADEKRKALEQQMAALQDERSALDQTIADAEYQKTLMQDLASRALTAPKKADDAKGYGAADLGQLLDLVGAKLQVFSKLVLDSRLRQRQIDQQVNELSAQFSQLAPDQQQRMSVIVHLAAAQASSGTIRLRYRIAGAGWRPVYDARLTSPENGADARIELVKRAAVTQSTTESWNDVALTLSTARPVGATAAPDLQAFLIEDQRFKLEAAETGNAERRLDAPAPASEPAEGGLAFQSDGAVELKKAKQAEAVAEIAGFQALYKIPGRVSIDNTGMAKNVRIGTQTIAAKLMAESVPKLDLNAYLTASFTLNGDTPLLPGAAMLYRDGVFMGQGGLPLLSPGEEARLGFGADDLVKVKRAEVKRLRGEEGLISTSSTDVRSYEISVTNLHGFKLPVRVLDQMPYSMRQDVTVETLSGMSPATVTDYEKKRGVLAWSFDLAPKAEEVIRHGFKVTWPKSVDVGMNVD